MPLIDDGVLEPLTTRGIFPSERIYYWTPQRKTRMLDLIMAYKTFLTGIAVRPDPVKARNRARGSRLAVDLPYVMLKVRLFLERL